MNLHSSQFRHFFHFNGGVTCRNLAVGVVDEDQPRLLIVDADGHLLLDGLGVQFVAVVVGRGKELRAEGGLPHPCRPQNQNPDEKKCKMQADNVQSLYYLKSSPLGRTPGLDGVDRQGGMMEWEHLWEIKTSLQK